MYYAHFGLDQAPFKITPNTEFFFSGANRGPILDALIYAITHGEGIVKVTGEVGSGKTMLCNMLQARLPANVDSVYLANPSVSPDEILHAIAFELQLMVPKEATRLEVMQALSNFLLQRHAQGRQVVVFVEESQSMPIATLEEIRLLSNLETGQQKLMQIVLFGQPELDENLRRPEIRQLRERISHSFALMPFKDTEIGDYLMFRLRAAGYKGPDLFSPGVVRSIARVSQGLTRRINLLADKALLAAYADKTHTITPRHVKAAIRDSEFARERRVERTLSVGMAISILAVGTGIGAVLLATWQAWRAPAPGATPSPIAAAPSAPAVAEKPQAPEPPPPPATAASPAAPPTVIAAPGGPAPAPSGAAAPDTRPNPGPPPPPRTADAPAAPAAKSPAAPVATPQPAPEAASGAVNASVAGAKSAGPAEPSAAAVAPAAVAPAPATTAGRVSYEERLAATTAWLGREKGETITIQLLGAENEDQLKQHLNIIAKFVESNQLFVYRTTAKQKPYVIVLYGSFGSQRSAQDALEKLPAALKAFRPYLRTVHGLRSDDGARPSAT